MSQPKSVFSVYSRLALNHCQFLMLLASFRFDWPSAVKSFFQLFQSVTDSPHELFSLDCLLAAFSPLPPFYNLLLLQMCLPLIGTLAITLFFCVRARLRRGPPLSCGQLTAPVLVMAFLLHPAVSRGIFSLFK